jgi:hypothetical protein
VRRLAWLTEDFAEWDTGVWVHYSQEPFVKIRPKQLHQDPAGIYLFPERFEPEGGWWKFPYKFLVRVEGLRRESVLDLARLTEGESVALYNDLVPEGERELKPGDFRTTRHADRMWEGLQRYFFLGKGRPGAGSFNKALRDLGYDAVFDDTGSIHTVEVQLLVLDPTKVKVVEMIDQSATGFAEVKAVARHLAEFLGGYGKVTVKEPRKGGVGWGEKGVVASVHVERRDDPEVYAQWKLAPHFFSGDARPQEINVRLEYSRPSLTDSSGWSRSVGATVDLRKWKSDAGDPQALGDMRARVKDAMDDVWAKAAAEKEPAPMVASMSHGRRLVGLMAEADVPIAKVYPRSPHSVGAPPKVPKFPLGTWARDGDGVRWQLRRIDLDDPNLVFPEGTTPTQLARDYAKWIEGGSPVPPLLAAENSQGKLIVVDGHQRAAAMRLVGVRDGQAWVAPAEYWDIVTGGEEFGEGVGVLPRSPFPSSVMKDPVYHGTERPFTRFEFRKGVVSVLGKAFEAERHAFFFTPSKEEAATFGPTVLTAYVNLRNPVVAPNEEPDAEDLAYILAPLVEIDRGGRAWLAPVTGSQVIGWDKAHSEEGESYEDRPEGWVHLAYTDHGIIWDVFDNAECVRRMKERGYDGSFVDEGQSATYGEGWSVAVFAPEQVEIVAQEGAGVREAVG